MRTIALRSDGICEFVNLVVSTPREKIPRTIHKSFWCEKCAQAALGSAGNFWIPGDAKILSEFRLVVDMSRRPCGLHSRVCPSGGVGNRSGVEFGWEVMECCWRRNLEDLFERKNTSDHCSLKLRGLNETARTNCLIESVWIFERLKISVQHFLAPFL